MRVLASLLLVLALEAHANPALHGTWSAAIDGQPLTVTFDANGSGRINGNPMRWQTLAKLLLVQQPSGQVVTYSFQVKGEELAVSGGDLNGIATLTRGTQAADAARAKQPEKKTSTPVSAAAVSAGGQELVGKWCKMSSFAANTGGSQRSTCFELRADGTYSYQSEGSMSASAPGMWGGTASQSGDAGRWKVSGNQLTAQSRGGAVNTYTLEKRNHPKNKRDPMICLDGECYVTFYNKRPW